MRAGARGGRSWESGARGALGHRSPSIFANSRPSRGCSTSRVLHQRFAAQVKGARVVVVCNLKPRKMAGIESQGMVLCASDANKTALDFVLPPAGAAVGERIVWEGFSGEPETAKKMDKKKAWEAIQPEFTTNADGVACWRGVPWALLSGGVCAASVKGGIIS